MEKRNTAATAAAAAATAAYLKAIEDSSGSESESDSDSSSDISSGSDSDDDDSSDTGTGTGTDTDTDTDSNEADAGVGNSDGAGSNFDVASTTASTTVDYIPGVSDWIALMRDTPPTTVVAVQFTASWCGPCQIIGPIFKALAHEFSGRGIVCKKVDVDENEQIMDQCEVTSMPTFQFYKNGEKLSEFSGNQPDLLKFHMETFGTPKTTPAEGARGAGASSSVPPSAASSSSPSSSFSSSKGEMVVRKDAAVSVANRELPPIPAAHSKDGSTSLVLFYQYIEPMWSKAEHKKALSNVIRIATESNVTGRGRCAKEGLNCTLTGSPAGVRQFCTRLRSWDSAFVGTDFKITDGLDTTQQFKALTIRKTDEIVAYGLAGEVAPSLHRNQARHVPADRYHEMMTEKDTVIIDVRNAYESAIGHFQPPPGGATLIDPKMRNSHEFPKWLNAPETKKMLSGKRVMMYCTGGIRCERASALLTQMSEVEEDVNPKEIVMVRGGIERYMKTFPEGGFWKGKNYLFDRRFEQRPELKGEAALAADVESQCCVCHAPWSEYRGQNKCAQAGCKVPVLVCTDCQAAASESPERLKCPLCVEGFHLRNLEKPDLKKQLSILAQSELSHAGGSSSGGATKRKTEFDPMVGDDGGGGVAMPSGGGNSGTRKKARRAKPAAPPSTRLYVGRIPLAVDAAQLKDALGGKVARVQWLADHATQLFYGSAFVEMESVNAAARVVTKAAEVSPDTVGISAKGKGKEEHMDGREEVAAGQNKRNEIAGGKISMSDSIASRGGRSGITIGNRRLRVAFAPRLKPDEQWPPPNYVETERPPIPC